MNNSELVKVLQKLVTDEDFLEDLAKPARSQSQDEFYDREFNDGLNAAREAIIQRINPIAIIDALKQLEQPATDSELEPITVAGWLQAVWRMRDERVKTSSTIAAARAAMEAIQNLFDELHGIGWDSAAQEDVIAYYKSINNLAERIIACAPSTKEEK